MVGPGIRSGLFSPRICSYPLQMRGPPGLAGRGDQPLPVFFIERSQLTVISIQVSQSHASRLLLASLSSWRSCFGVAVAAKMGSTFWSYSSIAVIGSDRMHQLAALAAVAIGREKPSTASIIVFFIGVPFVESPCGGIGVQCYQNVTGM